MGPILITGSEGLVGRGLRRVLEAQGVPVRRYDLRGPERCDVLDRDRLLRAAEGCAGIVHLAGVSRVVWGQRAPRNCLRQNVLGTRRVLDAALRSPSRPFVLFASSREVYGRSRHLPATEDAPLAPVNVYGRSKLIAERDVLAACRLGLRTAVVRLSNVYGDVDDHPDRVVPAFARTAAEGGTIRICGRSNCFDFTHVEDAARGVVALVHLLLDGERGLPHVHLLTGRPTTLGRLAALAAANAAPGLTVVDAPPRRFDVERFFGDPRRAERILGWRARITVEEGMVRLVREFAERAAGAGRTARAV
ncbi:MAG: SDR family oxidoreductase [Acidobacteria bacterium]|nr:MAG: SDR family oxidoreductase [Acidobacteriota bacterium]